MFDHHRIDAKWQKRWEEDGLFCAKNDSPKPKFYALVEFPYPSGAGLHVGHARSYTALDVVARKRRAEGFEVLYPIGWDAFGLPTENYAIKVGRKPQDVTAENVAIFRRQLKALGLSFDWSREVDTTDPSYYKWTQWMFLEFFKAGLAYKASVPINWCVSCKIGLANEEVVGGACERCGGAVEKRDKEQWMIAITRYADRLLTGLETVDYLPKIRKQQEDWIGKSEGAEVVFEVASSRAAITVFTTRPDTLFGATYIVLAPEHPLVEELLPRVTNRRAVNAYRKKAVAKSDMDRAAADREKTGVELKGVTVVNPANEEALPVWIADYVMMGYGTGAIMAVPAHDERDYAFAKKFGLPIRQVVAHDDTTQEVFSGDGTAINSDFLNGLATAQAKERMIAWLEERGKGARATHYKLRDWVFSRQRYWGEPIPLVYCDACEGTQTQKKDVFIFHGWQGSRTSDFFPSLLRNLESKGYNAFMFDAPNTEEPDFDEWLAFAKAKIDENKTGAPITIVGHSLGAFLASKLAEHFKLERLILAAPDAPLGDVYFTKRYSSELNADELKIYAQFYHHPHDIEAIKRNVDSMIFISSTDDPWVSPESRAYWYGHFGDDMRTIELNGRGHLSTETGITTLEALESCFDSLISNGWIPVPEDQLPVTLPDVESYQPTDTGESPLAAMDDWVQTTCPRCGGAARRETDTMPNWAGSSWYFLRYTDTRSAEAFASREALKHWMPVDWYNGGMEHTTLHLLYSRFWNTFLYDRGLVPMAEPYARRTSHGLIMAEEGTKMSKSKGNVVSPDEIVSKYGADTLRVYELFLGPFGEAVPWNRQGLVGVKRFLDRVARLPEMIADEESEAVTRALHKTVKKVGEDIEAMRFNTAVAAMMSFVNVAYGARALRKETLEIFLRVLHPFAPHLTEELHEGICDGYVQREDWPSFDATLVQDESVTIGVQVNGKVRGEVTLPVDAAEDEARAAAEVIAGVARYLENARVKSFVYVPGKIINFVTDAG